MATLKALLEKSEFKNVKTLLASGNILFESQTTSPEKMCKQIEALIEKKFGFTSHTIVRKHADLAKLVKSDPFAKIPVTKDTRLYVTLLSKQPKTNFKSPWSSPEKDFRILKVTSGEVYSVLDLSKGKGTVDSMKFLEKEFGKDVTTRNWNTVAKLVAA